jgi:hypothetical protein
MQHSMQAGSVSHKVQFVHHNLLAGQCSFNCRTHPIAAAAAAVLLLRLTECEKRRRRRQ